MADKLSARIYWFIAYKDSEGKKWRVEKAGYRYEENLNYQLYKLNELAFTGDTRDEGIVAAYNPESNKLILWGTTSGEAAVGLFTMTIAGKLDPKKYAEPIGKLSKLAAIAAFEDNDDPKASIKQPEVSNV